MAKITFFSVLKSNLKCAVCKKQNCPVKYYPERKTSQWYGGSRYFIRCEKDSKIYEERRLKNNLP